MRTFSHYLTELFDKPYPWKSVPGQPKDWTAVFTTTNGMKYKFYAKEGRMAWSVVFALMNPPKRGGKISMGSMDVEGTGDAFRVLATIREIFTKFVEDKKPNMIVFDAAKDTIASSRSKLYTRFSKQFAKKNGYDLEVTDVGSSMSYWFTKGK